MTSGNASENVFWCLFHPPICKVKLSPSTFPSQSRGRCVGRELWTASFQRFFRRVNGLPRRLLVCTTTQAPSPLSKKPWWNVSRDQEEGGGCASTFQSVVNRKSWRQGERGAGLFSRELFKENVVPYGNVGGRNVSARNDARIWEDKREKIMLISRSPDQSGAFLRETTKAFEACWVFVAIR